MAKAYSKAAKIRAKKARSEFALADVPRRAAQGRERMDQIKHEADPARTVKEARARHMGVMIEPEPKGDTKAAARNAAKLAKMRANMLSEEAGKALHLLCDPDTAKRLWGHFTALTAAEGRYHRSIGKSLYAKTAKIEFMREVFETRADDRPDLRSQDDRDREAVSAWMRWQGLIGRLSAFEQTAIFDGYRREVTFVDAGDVKMAGVRFVAAMRALDRVV